LADFFAAFFMAMRWLLVSWTYGYCSPVWNAAGVGPASSRRRATRAGTDSWQQKTRIARRCRSSVRRVQERFAGEMLPESTFESSRAEGFVVLRVVPVARLTLVRRSPLLGRKLITVFLDVNNPGEKFPGPGRARRRAATSLGAARRRRRRPRRNVDATPLRRARRDQTPCFTHSTASDAAAATLARRSGERGARALRGHVATPAPTPSGGRAACRRMARRNSPIAPICAKRNRPQGGRSDGGTRARGDQ
jgi:hypothetical protein